LAVRGGPIQPQDERFHRSHYILQRQWPHRVKDQIEPTVHLIPDCARHADTAYGTSRLQSHGDVHNIAVQVGAIGDSIAGVDTDAEPNTTVGWPIVIVRGNLLLHFYGATHRAIDAVEHHEKRIARGVKDPAAIVSDRRLDALAAEPSRRKVDLNALIDEALSLAYHGARAQDQSFNIGLERDFAEGIAPIELAPQDVTRVFLNLFSNGFYAATRRARTGADAGFMPTLKVTTRDAGEAVEVRVRDNGTGIPTEIRDKLFQPFFTTKPTGEGTGLGLSISCDIITQQHGGSITVDSKVGEYSEFVIRLPRGP
jgi:signal transduction histidine kinase